jgi:hypothetical protein
LILDVRLKIFLKKSGTMESITSSPLVHSMYNY